MILTKQTLLLTWEMSTVLVRKLKFFKTGTGSGLLCSQRQYSLEHVTSNFASWKFNKGVLIIADVIGIWLTDFCL